MENLVSYIIFVIYFILFIFSIFVLIKFILDNRDKKDVVKYQYYRDIPGNYGPEILGYLLTRNYMKREYMSASILELIRRKVFVIKKSSDDSFIISDNDYNNLLPLSQSEKYLKNWLINDIGDGISFNTDDLYISYIEEERKKNFERNFQEWSKIVIEMGKSENFYVENSKSKYEMFFIVSCLSIFLSNLFISVANYTYLILIVMLHFSFNALAFLYVHNKNPKTPRGKEEYAKWMGFKNFILEFSNIDSKDILDVNLWDRYYVYAVVLEITDKLDKTLLISDDYSVFDEDFFIKNVFSFKRELKRLKDESNDKKNILQKILYLLNKNRI